MKQDYIILWTDIAEQHLLAKARYIHQSSQNFLIAETFYNEIKTLTEKLSYIAGAYNDGVFHQYSIKNGHSVKFLVDGDYVYIADFIPKGKNN